MDLPPLSYFLLLGLSLLTVPALTRLPRHQQRLAFHLLGALALLWIGLILLFYDRLLCWPLAALAAYALARAGTRSAGIAGLLAAPAVLAGVIFQFQDIVPGLIWYFGAGLPVSLAIALAPLLLRFVHLDSRGLFEAAAVLLLASAIPFSAFAHTFVTGFELIHAAVYVVAMAGLASALVRRRPRLIHTVAELEPPPQAPRRQAVIWIVLSAAAFAAMASRLPEGPDPAQNPLLELAIPGVLTALFISLALRAWASRGRHVADLAAIEAAGVPPPEMAISVRLDAITVEGLEAVRRRLNATLAPLAVVNTQGQGPLDCLPAAAEAWLHGQQGRLVHVAWHEGPETFFVPPIVPEEAR